MDEKKINYTLWKEMGTTSPVINLKNSAQVVQSYWGNEHEKIDEIQPRRTERGNLLVSNEMSRCKINSSVSRQVPAVTFLSFLQLGTNISQEHTPSIFRTKVTSSDHSLNCEGGRSIFFCNSVVKQQNYMVPQPTQSWPEEQNIHMCICLKVLLGIKCEAN